jgi:4-amino-4-deoxy-L-arabinose transferase-like glycosyltransferase
MQHKGRIEMAKKENISKTCVFLFFLCAFLLISNGRFGGDGLENYLTAESIVLDKDFSIHDRPFGVPEMRYEVRGHAASDGKIYSNYGLGMAFILVPFYFVGHILACAITKVPHDYVTQFFVSLSNPAILALLSLTLFTFLQKLGYSLKTSFTAVSIYSLCTINIVYARSGFSEPTVACLIVLAVLAMFNYSKYDSPSALITAGSCVGYTIFIKKNSIILLPAFLVLLFYILVKNKKRLAPLFFHVAAFLLPIIISVLAIVLQNRILYGGIANTEFGTVGDMIGKVRTDSFPIKGLYYYLISPGKGILIYNIAMVLGFFAIKDFLKKYRVVGVFLLTLMLSNLAFYSFIFTRGSIFSWGPRYLFPTLPLITVFLAELWSYLSLSWDL